jgi:SAM-dependent methyltransferase
MLSRWLNRSRSSRRAGGHPTRQSVDVIHHNRLSWDALAADTAWPYSKHPIYLDTFKIFCDRVVDQGAVLDVGCGIGLPITRQLVDLGFKVTAVDFSAEMLARAKANVPEARFACLSAAALTYSEEFDGVVCSFSLIGLDRADFIRAAEGVVRALKPGGCCFIALNEETEAPDQGQDASLELYEVSSNSVRVVLYGRKYSQAELLTAFSDLTVVDIARETIQSERYGTESTILLILTKPLDAS